MLRNYFRSIWRNLWKNKMHSLLNISGLSIGLTCSILLVLYLKHELSYDQFQTKGDRIARVIMEYSSGGGEAMKGNFTSTKVLPAFKNAFPEVEDGVRMVLGPRIVRIDNQAYNEKKFMHADSTFFNLFSFQLLVGNKHDVLKAPNMVVLTNSTAKKYFGSTNPVGKTIKLGTTDDYLYTITGVMEDCPANSQIKFDFLASFSSFGPAQQETYYNANYTTYLLLKDEASIASLQKKILPFMKEEVKTGYDPGTIINFELEPMKKIHLYSPYDGFEANGNITYVYILGIITLFILLIACFTYINLSTARSIDRAKEVGVRKVIGAAKNQVFWQFIGESFFITGIALIVSFGLVFFMLPAFNALSDKTLHYGDVFTPSIIGIILSILVFISLFAGSYPALILSRLQPVRVLKGAFKNTNSSIWLRRSLIVFQFLISAFLITSTLIIRGQLQFIQDKKMGYNREQTIVLAAGQKMIEKSDLWKSELKKNSSIKTVSFSYETPVQIVGGYSMSKSSVSNAPAMNVNANPIDEDYIKVCGLEILAGQDLSKQDVQNASSEFDSLNYYHYILNESAVKALGWTNEDAIGKKLFLGQQRPGEVKAIVKDFHFTSLHSKIQPLVLFPGGWRNTLMLKVKTEDIPQTIAFLESKFKELAPNRPFDYHFMDEEFTAMYRSEQRTAKVFTIFSSIAILLACLGLFGLVAFTVNQRAKEISIRKVLGATVFGLSSLVAKDFLKLVMVAIIIATPLSYYFANQWLQDFSYRIELSWWIFALSAIVSIVIAYITVSFLSTKAAMVNPVKNLSIER
jgi:putative ABC transport system permease protein